MKQSPLKLLHTYSSTVRRLHISHKIELVYAHKSISNKEKQSW